MNKKNQIKDEYVVSALQAKAQNFEKELNTFRKLLFLTIIIYPIFGFINTFIQQTENFSIFIQRICFSVFLGIWVYLSYKIIYIKEKFYYIIGTLVYIGFAHMISIAWSIGFTFIHILGTLIVLMGTSFVFRRLAHLRLYLIYALSIITFSIFYVPKSEITSINTLSIFYAFSLILYIALQLNYKSQKKIQGNEANIFALIENTEGIIWSIDSKYNLLAFNKSFQYFINTLTNYIPEIGQSISTINYTEKLKTSFNNSYLKVFNGETIRFDEEIEINKEKKIFRFSLSPIKVDYTKIIGVTVLGNDITNEKNYELELIKAKELAEKLAFAKEHFLASMSHEIRTPLNGILGFTKILLQNPNLDETQKKQLNAVKSSGDILLVIINDILDLSKIEAGKMNIESTPIDIYSITKHAIDTFEIKTIEKDLKIQFNAPKTIPNHVLGDPVRISQILLNIINNSVKFTPNGGSISISLTTLNKTEASTTFLFEIKDTGIGIPKDQLQTIFDPFVQSSNDTARKFGGTGLGLSIVKKIIELLHGTISVESILGEGTKFNIELTFLNSTDPTFNANNENNIELKSQVDYSTIDYSKINILLAEDNLINQLLAQTVLNQFGFNVTTVDNGKLALNAVKTNTFDIILMDLMMPEMNGYEATEEIRKLDNKVKSSIPVIALTADVTIIDIEKCKIVGMNDYISKPFDPQVLLKKIETLLK